MSFTDLFIKRPVLAIVLSLVIVLLGLKAYTDLPLRQYPEITYPSINITTPWPGAPASLIKGFITTPIMNAVNSAEGVDYLTATSTDGMSTVVVNLQADYDVDSAFLEVSAKVNKIARTLPEEAENALVQKGAGSGGDGTLQYIGFFSEVMTIPQITDYLNKVILPQINSIDGMGGTDLRGASTFSMRIWLDPELMAAFSVTAGDVEQALSSNNFQSSAGETRGRYLSYGVSADTSLSSIDSFRELVIRGDEKALVRLGDIARIEMAGENQEQEVRFEGKPSVFVRTEASLKANPLDVAKRVRDLLPKIANELPPGLNVSMVFDTTEAIEHSINEVIKTLLEASVIVIVIIFLFLGSLRSMLIPVVTIPLSLIGVLFAMQLMGFSVNLLTLLAMVLAIGLVVDDAIVVVENIQRHIEEGSPPATAALQGAREIAFPVIAMTVTLAAVYAPIGFLGGLTGTLFTEFAFTLAGAVIVSGVVALTLSPMMCGRLLKSEEAHHGIIGEVDKWLDWVKNIYLKQLDEALNYRSMTLILIAFVFGSIVLLFPKISSELAPLEDDGTVFIIGQGPAHSNFSYTNRFATQIQGHISAVEEVDRNFMWVQKNSTFSLVQLVDWAERDRSAKEIGDAVVEQLRAVHGMNMYAYNFPPLPGAAPGLPVQMVLTSTASEKIIFQVTQSIIDAAKQSGKFLYVSGDLKFNKPTVDLTVDRNIAGEMGVSMADIGRNLSLMLGEGERGRFSILETSYKVIPQANADYRWDPSRLDHYHVRAANGDMVPLSALVEWKINAKPNQLNQFQQLNANYIGALPAPGVSMGEALTFFEDAAKQYLPAGFTHDYVGQARQLRQEGSALFETFVFSFMLIYLVLAAQFESFRDPFIVLISVPMSICGALIPLAVGLATMNIYTQIGMVTLIGLISKHGILIVDFANNLQEQGLSRAEAAREAASVRLRPILMTTAAMVFGVVPLLLATGAGAASRFSIGLVISSGMTIGTLFTLFVVPVLYTYIAERKTGQAVQNTPESSEKTIAAE